MINYSFVIPHKNDIESLKRCVNSIPERNDVEIVVVDDCSNEKPVLSRKGLKIIYLKKSHGAGYARNIGLDNIAGKWVLFADCDDFYEKDFLTELDKWVDKDLDIVYFDVHFRYKISSKSEHYFMKSAYDRWVLGDHSYQSEIDVKHGYNVPWNKMTRLEYVKKIFARFEEIPVGNDALFVHQCAAQTHRIDVINHQLYYYVDNECGLTRKKHTYESIRALFKSTVRVNRIKAKAGAWKQIMLPWFDFPKYYRMFGFWKTLRLYIEKIICDVNPCILIYKKMKLRNK